LFFITRYYEFIENQKSDFFLRTIYKMNFFLRTFRTFRHSRTPCSPRELQLRKAFRRINNTLRSVMKSLIANVNERGAFKFSFLVPLNNMNAETMIDGTRGPLATTRAWLFSSIIPVLRSAASAPMITIIKKTY